MGELSDWKPDLIRGMGKRKLIHVLLCVAAAVVCLAGCGGNTEDDGTNHEGKGSDAVTESTLEEDDTTLKGNDINVVDDSGTDNTDGSDGTGNGQDDNDSSVANNDSLAADSDDPAENSAKDRWKGAGISVLGDSISTFDGWIPGNCVVFYPLYGEVTDVSETWWHQVIEEAEMELCTNNSSAGCTCTGDSTSIDDPAYACSGGRISMLMGSGGRLPELILVYLGTNDLLKGIPLGDNDGTRLVEEGEIDNFSDAYSLILDKLASEYPTAQVYCCTLAQVGDWGTEQPFVTFENHLGLTAADYSESIRTVAAGKGVPVIDLYNCGIEIDNLQQMSSDGVHLTPDGMKLVKEAVLKAILSDDSGE